MTKGEYESRIQTVCLAFLTIFALAVTLYLLRVVLVPFILAAFLTLVLLPIVNFLMRYLRIGRPIALLLTLFLGFLSLIAVGVFVSVSVGQFANSAGEYERQLTKLVARAEGAAPVQKVATLIAGTNVPESLEERDESADETEGTEETEGAEGARAVERTEGAEEIEALEGGSDPGAVPSAPREFRASMLLPDGAAQGIARRLSSSVLSVLSNGLLVMLFTAFLLMGGTASSIRKQPGHGVVAEIEMRVQKYIVIKICSSLLTGFLIFFVLHFLGVRFAMSFGTFAFVLNFVPNIGSIVATLLPLPVVLLTPDVSMVTVALALLLPLTIQFLIGSVIEPKIMGDTLGLHPVVVLMSLIFWGMLWGFSGMLLAIPMTAIAKIVFERIEVTRPFAGLLEGRLDALDEM